MQTQTIYICVYYDDDWLLLIEDKKTSQSQNCSIFYVDETSTCYIHHAGLYI